MLRCKGTLLALIVILAIPVVAAAQQTSTEPTQTDQELLKPEQLEALVAPIALYPDALLANVLAASTYPLEVVEADRWVTGHKELKGDQLKAEVDKVSWDDSVKALMSTPTVLAMMSEKLDWTRSLGDAVLAQQPDVMDAIQRLRSKAYDNKKLVTTKEQKVTVQQEQNRQVLVIEPTDPNTMYVPYYEPSVVYGEWPYPAYPPYYFGYPSYIGAGVIATGLAFGAGFALGRWSNYWGGRCNWNNNNFFINRSNNVNWQHRPEHRQGVRYNNAGVQQRFGNNNLRAGAGDRMDFRGRGGQQVLNHGKDGVVAGDRGPGDRTGDRGGGDRPGAGDRGGGDRAAARGGAGPDRAGSSDRSGANRRGGNKGGAKQAGSANRPGGAAGRDGGRNSALQVQPGRAASAQSARGRASFASMPRGGGGGVGAGGGGARMAPGGGFRGGAGGGRGGGGRRSDIAVKHDVVRLGYLRNGLGYYRFSYLGSRRAYVGVIAQEVQAVRPDAITRGSDGYLRVYYDRLGIKFRTFQDWLASGARIPTGAGI